MSACVESNATDPQIGSKNDIKTSNINIVVTSFNNTANHYHKFNNEVTISGLPALQTLSTLNCSDIGIDVNSYDSLPKGQCQDSIKTKLAGPVLTAASFTPSSSAMPSTSSTAAKPPFIQIPFGWKRELLNDQIVYYSPTNVCIQSMDELSAYLQTEGTDKTGLECPLHIDLSFNFDASVPSKPFDIEVAKRSKQFCNQKQRIIALATYKQYSLQSQQLIAEENQHRIQQQIEAESQPQTSETNIQTCDRIGAQQADYLDVSKHFNAKYFNQSVSVVQTNQNFDTCDQTMGITNATIGPKCPNPLPHNVNHGSIPAGHHQYIKHASNSDNHCQYSVPLGSDSFREGINSFCIYDQNINGGVYSVSTCDSGQITVQPNEKTSIYLAQNPCNYGQMISYENSNVNLVNQITSHPQVISAEDYHHYSHAFHASDSLCNTSLTSLPSYIPLPSANANTGAISFNHNALPPNAITLNQSYPSQDTSHCHSQNNHTSILPANPSMPPISVPNVTTVTTSVSDVIPAVGLGPQIINTTNASGAPQVLQFINSVPLTQITANTVTVLQQSPAQEVSVPATTLIIPQLMASHEHPMVINHAMAPQTAVFPHIATALSNAFPSAINIANAIAMPQRTITETSKPSRSRRRKEYTRTNRTHPPTVASILKRADNEKKQKELNDKQKLQQKDQELQTINDNNESNCESSPDNQQKESISVAVQSELMVDSDNYW